MTRSRSIRWLWIALLVPIACATGQTPDRAKVGAALGERTGVAAHDLPAPGAEWATPPGTSLTDGLTIDEAVSIALWNNANFQVALSSLGLARADLIEAGQLKNPALALLFPWGPKQLEFTVTWAVDAIWQRPKRIAGATINAEAVGEQLVQTGLRLIADVRMSYYDVLVSERRLTLAIEQSRIAIEAATMAAGRLRAGDISEFEAGLVKMDSVRLQTARLTRETARDLAVIRLRTLLGLATDAPTLKLVEPAAQAGCEPGPELLKSALAARPDVRAADLQVEAAGTRAGLEKARIFAFTVSLDANAHGSEGFELGPGIVAELPILSQTQGGRARAKAEIEQAARRYLAVRAMVSADVAAASASLNEARQAARLLGADVDQTIAVARRQAESLFSAGEISLLELLQTRQRLIEIESTRADAAFGVNRAIVALEQAIGRSCSLR